MTRFFFVLIFCLFFFFFDLISPSILYIVAATNTHRNDIHKVCVQGIHITHHRRIPPLFFSSSFIYQVTMINDFPRIVYAYFGDKAKDSGGKRIYRNVVVCVYI